MEKKMNKQLPRWASALILGVATAAFALVIVSTLSGCTVSRYFQGGGEWAVGVRADNMLILSHTVDGDKQNVTASTSASLEVDDLVTTLLGPDNQTEATETTGNPETPEAPETPDN